MNQTEKRQATMDISMCDLVIVNAWALCMYSWAFRYSCLFFILCQFPGLSYFSFVSWLQDAGLNCRGNKVLLTAFHMKQNFARKSAASRKILPIQHTQASSLEMCQDAHTISHRQNVRTGQFCSKSHNVRRNYVLGPLAITNSLGWVTCP